MGKYDNTTRIVYMNRGGTCLYAYALSYRGAQKVLFYNSMNYQNQPIDFGIHDMCRLAERKFRCVSVFPQLVDNHRGAGVKGKDSDISSLGEEGGERKKGFSYNIVNSVRINAGTLIDGDLKNIKSQWPEDVMKLEGDLRTKFEKE